MNKEEKNSHLIALKLWVLHFSPYCRSTPQGIRVKLNQDPRIIWDGSTKDSPHQIVLNEVTPTDAEATIDFGKAKTTLLVNIYNWRVSFPDKTIFIALADITACFRFARISADITGAFGFMADSRYFIATSHVFGSNTSASSWEPLRRAIEAMIPIHMKNSQDLIIKHASLLESLKWEDPTTKKVLAQPCPINQGILQQDRNLTPPKGNIYVDDILSAGVGKDYVRNLLAATIESIFTVCGDPDITMRQCPLSLKKWRTTKISPTQIVLGLVIDTNQMTVGLPQEYRDQVKDLLTKWPKSRRLFRANDMQKLIGKIARLGEGAPWIFKIMSHLYTSLAIALQTNKKLLEFTSQKFRDIVACIQKKQFTISTKNEIKEINFAIKSAAKMVNHAKTLFPINESMREELDFIRQALDDDSDIKFETPIAFLIPRTPTALAFGNSSLLACGGYSIELKFWWHLRFPEEIVARTLLHIKNAKSGEFISINVLEYVTVIINYCGALVALANENKQLTGDPHPIILCITDNTSAKNWTLHTSKKSIVGRALARFFCGILINSRLGINAKWISTHTNVIADDISRFTNSPPNNSPHTSKSSYDFSTLKQNHEVLRTCLFYQPSHKLLSLIWKILLTKQCPALSQIRILEPADLGKLST